MIKLILFDMDGTLVDAGDLSPCGLAHVVRQFAGPATGLGDYSLSGKTDPQIMRDLLLLNGVPRGRVDQMLEAALGAYQSYYLSQLEYSGITALEGARELIERLAAAEAPPAGSSAAAPVLGILTGNLRGIIAPKLAAVGIPPARFPVVACGSDDADRNRLPAIAVHRAEGCSEARILPSEVVIVGDTPRDVESAKSFGSRSVAVASGDYTYEQLQTSQPAYLLTSLLEWSVVEQEI